MVRLVMYSDQIIPENDKVDAHLLYLLAGRGHRIGYVASGPEPDRRFYRQRRDYYAKLDLDLSVFLDTSGPLDESGRNKGLAAAMENRVYLLRFPMVPYTSASTF